MRADKLAEQKLSPPSRLFREMGFDLLHLGEYPLALKSLNQAYESAEQRKDVEQQAYACLSLAEYYVEVEESPEPGQHKSYNSDEHQKPDEAGHYHSANALQESLTMADKANKWFHDLNDQVMAGAA